MRSPSLSPEQAARLRAAYKGGTRAPVLAERFGIDRRTVYRYVKGLARPPKRLTPEQRHLVATLPGSAASVARKVGCGATTVLRIRAKATAC